MQVVIEFLKSDAVVIAIPAILLLVLILYIVNVVKLKKIQKNYKSFLKKIGTSNNIEEDLRKFMERVEEVDKENEKLREALHNTNNVMSKCLRKVGIVRYTAFENLGSDLSFALALLDEENSGVVLNGIYSGDMSNIYAKPIKNGESTYTLSEQEKEAIKKAVDITA